MLIDTTEYDYQKEIFGNWSNAFTPRPGLHIRRLLGYVHIEGGIMPLNICRIILGERARLPFAPDYTDYRVEPTNFHLIEDNLSPLRQSINVSRVVVGDIRGTSICL